jgi:hypothetical protein
MIRRVNMTKLQAEKLFKEEVMPNVIERYGRKDKPALQSAWNDFVDTLYKDEKISYKQAYTWNHPKFIK